jgi:cytoskeleton protein RodZ
MSIEAASQSVKIKPEVLRAIEADETGHIPAVYLKGYIRSYARLLGIPWSSIEPQVQAAQGAEPAVQTIFTEGPPRHSGERWIKSSSYVIASAVVIALVWQFTNEAVRFSQGDPMLRPVQDESAQAQSPQPESNMQGSSAQGKPALIHPPTNTHLRASIASMNSMVGQGQVRRSPPTEAAWANMARQSNANGGADSGLHALEITTSADSWIEIVDGQGNRVEMDLLRAGSRRSYQAAAPLRLLLGRASSVEVFHNGEKVDLGPNTRGNVARVTLGAPEPASEPEVNAPDADDAPREQG